MRDNTVILLLRNHNINLKCAMYSVDNTDITYEFLAIRLN